MSRAARPAKPVLASAPPENRFSAAHPVARPPVDAAGWGRSELSRARASLLRVVSPNRPFPPGYLLP